MIAGPEYASITSNIHRGCVSLGLSRERESVGDRYEGIYCHKLTYAIVGAGEASYKSTGLAVRNGSWNCLAWAKAAVTGGISSSFGKPQFCTKTFHLIRSDLHGLSGILFLT